MNLAMQVTNVAAA
jgi:anaerobic glycerol-3-phosphate dehydrogenase